jgi:diguanylate cyclase (GGDEF)-like protein
MRDAFWLCVPVTLLVAAGCRRQVTAALAGATIVAVAAVVSGTSTGGNAPPAALAILVPGASLGVLLAVRRRLERERDALRTSALTDPLTGVANRRSLLERIEYEIARHRRTRRSFALVMLDLDGFKLINDRFGHPAGDELLREVAAALSFAVREQDTVARIGGDEFCVLAPETARAGAHRLVDRAAAAMAPLTAGAEAFSACAGVAVFPQDGATVDALVRAADQRLLSAKRELAGPRSRAA